MKTTIIATALTLIAIGTLPATAQTGRTDTATPVKANGSGASSAAPTDPKATPTPKATADDPKATPDDPKVVAAEPATVADDPKAADGEAAAAAQDDEDDPDLDVNLAQPDYTIVALPTTLRLPKGKFAFRVTHRFGRPLDDGNFGDLAADAFGFDSGGLIGLEVRYGVLRGTQVGVLRTSDRTIQMFAQQQIVGQEKFPLGMALHLTMDGTNNFQDSYSPGIGLVVSREIGKTAAVYFEPTWVNNTNTLPSELADDNSAFLIGLGGRVRVSRRAYLVGELAPRVSGFDPGSTHASVGVEMRAGGHAFQINFSRGLGTTMGQVARGGTEDDWFIGFNISRKFW
ncbi:hypothetical protein LuPra_00344 [Luteitalea pratensis]|uniref:DUF5777 domain-containing protein n=1 Tax=Luteitalea pratensis TaxID=1855912 RepID=A0A143PF72_LUTPR|nr:DUF5777 family beta-barrel protein [Luteitalea pratensis]AMY07177.1 hypothetical protein LuPra_00344 [Luteitalea pratensis]